MTRDYTTVILGARLATLAVVVLYCALSFYDLLRLNRSNGIINAYQLVFGMAALASEALPLTAETSVYPFIPMMKSPKGRFVLYALMAIPLFSEDSSLSSSSGLCAYCLSLAASLTASRSRLELLQQQGSKLMESSLEERVYQGL